MNWKFWEFFKRPQDPNATIRVKIGCEQNENEKLAKPWNKIKTSKYTIFTFFPLTILGQFMRIANFYFLVITIINFNLEYNSVSPSSSLIPLAIVVGIAVLKQAHEDYVRNKSDRAINETIVTVIRGGKTQDIQAQYVASGDLVLVKENTDIPCDLVLIQSSDKHNKCYVTTVNLDGESNLKTLCVPKGLPCVAIDQLASLGEIECESPKTDLYHFTGKIVLNNQQILPLETENLLMRGSHIKNTEEAIGCAVYLGMTTKSQLNSRSTGHKRATSERLMNAYLLTMVVAMIVCVTLLYLLMRYAEHSFVIKIPYFGPPVNMNSGKEFFNDYFTLLVMFNFMIPISMYGTLEIYRSFGVLFLRFDLQLYDEEIDEPCIVRTSNLNEELGQIDILFSDKTGTLTKNEMIFQQCSINGQKYVYQKTYLQNVDTNEINDIHFFTHHQRHFFEALAICHTVVAADRKRTTSSIFDKPATPNIEGASTIDFQKEPHDPHTLMRVLSQERQEEIYGMVEELDYQASSSDEKALIEACAHLGLVYLGDSNEVLRMRVIPPHNNKNEQRPKSIGENRGVSFERLNILEFTADRKRMSVIVRDWKGYLWIYTKGADTVILPLCTKASAEMVERTQKHVDEFAREGLRTLVIGRRQLDEKEYLNFLQQLQFAHDSLDKRRELSDLCCELVERDFELLGATGVEDMLQDNLAETLEALQEADIRTWVLTGDKVETAHNIALACGHLPENATEHFIVNCNDKAEVLQHFQSLSDDVMKNNECALLIDGKSLSIILEEVATEFRDLAVKCKAVLCCRLSPLQKSDVVALMKGHQMKFITAAIGDGANDVSMIQEAHVGIGIIGKEGRQAAMAADYSIGRFNMIRRLLFVHGHFNTIRLSRMVHFYFYQNMLITGAMFIFQFYNLYSGTGLYDSFLLSMYTTVFTGVPNVMLGIFEKPFNEEVLMSQPSLYKECRRYKPLNFYKFLTWMTTAVYQTTLIYFFAYVFFVSNNVILSGGLTADLLCFGNLIAQCVVFVANSTLWLAARYMTRWFLGALAFSYSIFIISTVIDNVIHYSTDTGMYWSYNMLLASIPQWLFTIVTVIACLLPSYLLRYYYEGFRNRKTREIQLLNTSNWCGRRRSQSEMSVLMSY